MATLEELTPGASLQGILPDSLVTVISVQWHGSEAIELTYKTSTRKVANELLFRADESRLELALKAPLELRRLWSLFRLVSEAQRVRLAHLFDPVLAVKISNVEPQDENAGARMRKLITIVNAMMRTSTPWQQQLDFQDSWYRPAARRTSGRGPAPPAFGGSAVRRRGVSSPDDRRHRTRARPAGRTTVYALQYRKAAGS